MISANLAIVKGDMKICVGYLPAYKKPCMYIYTTPTCIRKLATFNDHESAEEFIEYLADMMEAVCDVAFS